MKYLNIKFILTMMLFATVSLTINPVFALEESAADGEVNVKALPMTDGEVKKIDKDTGKITIKHEPIVNLGMPGMTMVFKVKEETMLDQVKQGDRIKFITEKINGALTVTKIEMAK